MDFKIFELQSLLIFQSSEPPSSSPNKKEDKIDTTAMPLNVIIFFGFGNFESNV